MGELDNELANNELIKRKYEQMDIAQGGLDLHVCDDQRENYVEYCIISDSEESEDSDYQQGFGGIGM
jgi:hypothetical protein